MPLPNQDAWGKSRYEHKLWRELCSRLLELGAVTEQDLRSKLSVQNTPGQKLLGIIRIWGNARVDLAQCQTETEWCGGRDLNSHLVREPGFKAGA